MFVLNKNKLIIFSFLGIVISSLLFSLLPGAYWEEGARWIFLIGYEFAIFFLALFLPLFQVVRKKYNFFLFSALLILFSSIIYELYDPGYFSTVKARAAGLPGNSNLSALVIALLCAALLRYDFEKSKLFDFSVLIVGGLSIFLTLSRSGLLEFLVIIICYFGLWVISSRHKKLRISPKRILFSLLAFAALATVVIVVIPQIIEKSNLFNNSSAQNRLNLLSGQGNAKDESGESRYNAILESIYLINQAPIFGHGTAHSRTMEELPHNMYLNQWINNGIFGLVFYLCFLITALITFRKRNFVPGQVFMLVAIIGSFFSHNVLDHRPFLILLGMMCSLSLQTKD